ncbi:hypothetical protein Agub_g11316 [Astrephomene gubernaculifera]|uniref:Uncharacterized protein n=1 Tax=Astrephomene gubernaculifera TaxID=47775 RepID=A0AAD3HPR4_9CHLO|nr:hypothetical protein Agub_g11316 [Astrephomene gubernaculifera]
MPGPGNSRTVEERLEKARLIPRLSTEVLNMCKSVDQLLRSQHTSNLSQAIVCVHEIARQHFAVVVALKWAVLLVDLLEADNPDVRLSACNALAAVCVAQEGRDAVRSAGGLRPLVMLLAEGSRSPLAAAAAAALMNCSACDVCKEAIADCRGVPQLLGLIRDALARCIPPPPGSSQAAAPAAAAAAASGSAAAAEAAAKAPPPASPPPAGRSGSGSGATEGVEGSGGSSSSAGADGDGGSKADLRTPGECKAAAYAAGALMNMGGLISVQEKMLQAGAVSVLQEVCRVAAPDDPIGTRAGFVLSWLAVGSGALDAELQQLLAAAGAEAGEAGAGSRPESRVVGPGAATGGAGAGAGGAAGNKHGHPNGVLGAVGLVSSSSQAAGASSGGAHATSPRSRHRQQQHQHQQQPQFRTGLGTSGTTAAGKHVKSVAPGGGGGGAGGGGGGGKHAAAAGSKSAAGTAAGATTTVKATTVVARA